MSQELRGNALLESLPDWLPDALPRLQSLDVSACSRLDLRSITAWTQLTTLSLQVRLWLNMWGWALHDIASALCVCRPCRLPGPHLLLPHARLSHLAHPTGPPSARQALDLVWGATPPRLLAQAVQHGIVARVKQLPDLSPLRHLAALNLADNNLVEVGGLVGGWVGWCVGVPEARACAELLIAAPGGPNLFPGLQPHLHVWLPGRRCRPGC